MTDQRGGYIEGVGRTVVVIPTYNERATLPAVLNRLHHAVPDAHALVVDDESPDGTGLLADELAANDSRLHVLHRPIKAGLGVAYVAGFRWALEQGYDVVVEMDADGSHAPEDLPRLLGVFTDEHPGADADVVLGSRYVPGGRVLNWPRYREWLSRGAAKQTAADQTRTRRAAPHNPASPTTQPALSPPRAVPVRRSGSDGLAAPSAAHRAALRARVCCGAPAACPSVCAVA